MTTKLCATCDSPEHLTKECPQKNSFQERRAQRRTQAQKHGHLYQRFKTSSAAPLIKFMQTQSKFKNKSFAQAVKGNRPQTQSTPQISIPAPIALTSDLKQTLQAVNALNDTLNQITSTLKELDKRLRWVEDAAYHWTISQEEECSTGSNEHNHEEPEEISYTEDDLNMAPWEQPPLNLAAALSQSHFQPRKHKAQDSPLSNLNIQQLHQQISQATSSLSAILQNINNLAQQFTEEITTPSPQDQ
jgi:hypothetical protein